MLESDGREFLLFPLLNYGTGSYDGLHDMMSEPMTVQGLGDGGARLRDRLRREHDDIPAHPLGSRSSTRAAVRTRVGGAAPERPDPAAWCSGRWAIRETIVAGETVVSAGELTDARPGTLVRGS